MSFLVCSGVCSAVVVGDLDLDLGAVKEMLVELGDCMYRGKQKTHSNLKS